ncbi:MAG: hypothetical protein GXO49_02690 [Chlorobi bacterium]|nr:hypothetical protein [Chlorobiota bacterium]
MEKTDLEALKPFVKPLLKPLFAPIIKESIKEVLLEIEKEKFEKQTFTKTEVAEMMNKSYNYVTSLINKGYLKTTLDGKLITGRAINEYYNEIEN